MISNHYPTMYGDTTRSSATICSLGVIILGFALVRWMYGSRRKVAGF